jgi:uncharacterized YigZ family protein
VARNAGAPEPGRTSLAGPAEAELVISKSRFLAWIEPVATPEAASAVIASRRKAHHSARHHCSAMILGPAGAVQRSNDDGEPSGTAGAPMLEVLRQRRVTDAVAVVTRYFGGVLLGAGGLVRAYSGAVAAGLDAAVIVHYAQRTEWRLTAPAGRAGRLEHALRSWGPARAAPLTAHYGAAEVAYSLLLPPEDGPAIVAFAAAHGAGIAEGATRAVALP